MPTEVTIPTTLTSSSLGCRGDGAGEQRGHEGGLLVARGQEVEAGQHERGQREANLGEPDLVRGRFRGRVQG